jgi:hypothetical protein
MTQNGKLDYKACAEVMYLSSHTLQKIRFREWKECIFKRFGKNDEK